MYQRVCDVKLQGKNNVKPIDRAIKAVYKLYRLSEDEIKVVEGEKR